MTALPRHPIAAASSQRTASPPRARNGEPSTFTGAGRDDYGIFGPEWVEDQIARATYHARMAEAFEQTADDEPSGGVPVVDLFPPLASQDELDRRSIWDVEFGMNWQSFVALGFVLAFVGTVVWWFMALVGECAGCGL